VDAGLLPVRGPDGAKSRLAALGPDARARIVAFLLDRALALCGATPALRWWVLSDDRGVLRRAAEAGLGTLEDEAPGLNGAVAAALRRLAAAGAASATILPGDVPLATSDDVDAILAAGRRAQVVVVPSRDGGTNALHLRPPTALDPGFGPGSCTLHLRRATARGLSAELLRLPRLELDVDNPDDVAALDGVGPSRTRRDLEERPSSPPAPAAGRLGLGRAPVDSRLHPLRPVDGGRLGPPR
jgi:2-phospho-L-lactate/phosphoenolpyruvate guanylyltransferase